MQKEVKFRKKSERKNFRENQNVVAASVNYAKKKTAEFSALEVLLYYY